MDEIPRPKASKRSTAGSSNEEEYEYVGEMDETLASFALNLLRKLDEEITESRLFSPAGLAVLFAALHRGSDERTQKEIRLSVFSGLDEKEMEALLRIANRALNRKSKLFEYKHALRLNYKPTLSLSTAFSEYCRKSLKMEFEKVDFGNLDWSREVLIDWLTRNSQERISPEALQLQPHFGMVLHSLLVFKGGWHLAFKPEYSQPATFYLTNRRTTVIRFTETEDVQVVGKRFDGAENLRLFFFLPKKRCGLKHWLKYQTGQTLAALTLACQLREMNLRIPKWSSVAYVDIQKQWNFLRKSYWTDIAEGAKLNQCLHFAAFETAGLEVEEGGGKVNRTARGARLERESSVAFIADHPFLYTLQLDTVLLLAGVFAPSHQPSQESSVDP